MTLTLTMQQRINLEVIIRDKRYNDTDDAIIMHGLTAKIRIPDPTRATFVKDLSDGRSLIDIKSMSVHPDITVELDPGEILKLTTRLEEWRKDKGITIDDVDWFVPLIKDLAAPPSPASVSSIANVKRK